MTVSVIKEFEIIHIHHSQRHRTFPVLLHILTHCMVKSPAVVQSCQFIFPGNLLNVLVSQPEPEHHIHQQGNEDHNKQTGNPQHLGKWTDCPSILRFNGQFPPAGGPGKGDRQRFSGEDFGMADQADIVA